MREGFGFVAGVFVPGLEHCVDSEAILEVIEDFEAAAKGWGGGLEGTASFEEHGELDHVVGQDVHGGFGNFFPGNSCPFEEGEESGLTTS